LCSETLCTSLYHVTCHHVQNRLEHFCDGRDLRQYAAQLSTYLHEQGSPVPRLRGDRSPRLPARAGDNAADKGRIRRTKKAPAIIARSASDEAIRRLFRVAMDCFAPLATTW